MRAYSPQGRGAALWPRWVPFCTAAETLKSLSATEGVTYLQLDLPPMLKRGAILHWSLTDALVERQALLLLGASLGESSPITKPSGSAAVPLADVRALKAIITPIASTSARVRFVANVDLQVPKMPSTLVSMVTKKIAGAVLSLLFREAQKVSVLDAEAAESGGAPAIENPYLRKVNEHGAFYQHVEGLTARYFEMFGEDEDESGEAQVADRSAPGGVSV